jgi:hypothetical protein
LRIFIGGAKDRRLRDEAHSLDLSEHETPALSITIKSLSWRLRPDAENFAAPLRINRPSIW